MPNTAKQEAIRKAYGEYWDQVKNSIDDDGYILGNAKSLPNKEFDGDGFGYIRPKSLQGIENNNGWIRIESDEDLPKSTIDTFYTYGEDYGIKMEGWGNLKIGYRVGRITHYQPIVKPEKPIY